MSSPARVLAILNLFDADHPAWNPDDINQRLGYTRTTGYRYVKELVDLGYLQKVSSARYALGPKIIELDYQLRRSDPLLLAAIPVMSKLSALTGFDAVLSVLFLNARQIIDTHRVSAQPELELSYGRGRPRPFLRSSAPKVLLSCLKPTQLKAIHAEFESEIATSEMGPDFDSFKRYLRKIKKQGYYASLGELEPGIGAIAVPVFNSDGEALAAMALVASIEKIEKVNQKELAGLLREGAAEITGTI